MVNNNSVNKPQKNPPEPPIPLSQPLPILPPRGPAYEAIVPIHFTKQNIEAHTLVLFKEDGRIHIGAGLDGHYLATDEIIDGRRVLQYHGRYRDHRGHWSLDEKLIPGRQALIDEETYQALKHLVRVGGVL